MVNENTKFVTWNNRLSCGIKLIDDQHKKLVELTNEMFEHASGNVVQEHDYFNNVIQEIVVYIKVHFATEEKIMLLGKFAGYAEHKKEHERFISLAAENVCDYQSGKRHSLSSFSRFLKDWILSHIAIMDKKYFEHFKNFAACEDEEKLAVSLNNIPEIQDIKM